MTKEFKNEKYTATIGDDGLLTVRDGPRVLRETTFKDGKATVKEITLESAPDDSTRTLLTRMNQMPVFQACHAGKRLWNVDIDCGMSRFNGTKPQRELVKALQNCCFDPEQIDDILGACKKAPKWDYCPRQW